MNLQTAYTIVDSSGETIFFPGDPGVQECVRLEGLFSIEQLEAAALILRSRNEALQPASNRGRSRCIHCTGPVVDSFCAWCDL